MKRIVGFLALLVLMLSLPVKVGAIIFINEMVSYPFSIFFHRDSYQLMSNRDLVNLREIADVATEYGYKIRLRGQQAYEC